MVKGIDIKAKELTERPCDICDLTKSFRYCSGGYLPRADKALRVLHLDSFQIKPIALSGIRWGALLTDDFSRMRWCVYSKNKGELGLVVRDRCLQLQNEYDSLKAGLDERGIEVDWDLTGDEIWYLGIRIDTGIDEGLRISQDSHIRKMVEGIAPRPAETPMEPGTMTHALPQPDMASPDEISEY